MADPIHLASGPLIFKAGYKKGSVPGTGAIREAIAVGMWLREEITAFEAPRSYSYKIVRAVPAFNHDVGVVTCTPSAGGTHVDWTTTYTHPARAGGRFLESITAPLIRSTFGAILAACEKAMK